MLHRARRISRRNLTKNSRAGRHGGGRRGEPTPRLPSRGLGFALTPMATAAATPEGHESADDQESEDSNASPHENVHRHNAPRFLFCRFIPGKPPDLPKVPSASSASRIGTCTVVAQDRRFWLPGVPLDVLCIGVQQAAARLRHRQCCADQRNLNHLLDILVHHAPPFLNAGRTIPPTGAHDTENSPARLLSIQRNQKNSQSNRGCLGLSFHRQLVSYTRKTNQDNALCLNARAKRAWRCFGRHSLNVQLRTLFAEIQDTDDDPMDSYCRVASNPMRCLLNFSSLFCHNLTQWSETCLCDVETCDTERDPDYRTAPKNARNRRTKRQPKACEYNPNEIQQGSPHSSCRRRDEFLPKRAEGKPGNPKTRYPKRNPNDCAAPKQSD